MTEDPRYVRPRHTTSGAGNTYTYPPTVVSTIQSAGERVMSGAASCAFVLGLMAMVTFGIFGIPAIVVGSSARRRTRTGEQGGNGLACVGIMLGWFSIAGWLLLLLLLLFGAQGALLGGLTPEPELTP